MIHLSPNALRRTKKEHIESLMESCKQIFSDRFADNFFRDDNLMVAFCTAEDKSTVYEALCKQFFPLYLSERYSRTSFFAAQAMTNADDGIYGIRHKRTEWRQPQNYQSYL